MSKSIASKSVIFFFKEAYNSEVYTVLGDGKVDYYVLRNPFKVLIERLHIYNGSRTTLIL